jgi:hypothetical protein
MIFLSLGEAVFADYATANATDDMVPLTCKQKLPHQQLWSNIQRNLTRAYSLLVDSCCVFCRATWICPDSAAKPNTTSTECGDPQPTVPECDLL